MKKLLSLLLAALLLCSCFAVAEIDVSGMSYEELTELNRAVQLELFKKGALIDGVKVPAGRYIVGEDIPEGVYRIESGSSYASIAHTNIFDTNYFSYFLTKEENVVGRLALKARMEIEISGTVIFYTYTGLFGK